MFQSFFTFWYFYSNVTKLIIQATAKTNAKRNYFTFLSTNMRRMSNACSQKYLGNLLELQDKNA
ncbi:MAG: hypothetical protein CL842_02470 [Crocinitomicaceae bacterium]|nr:hypothetical protein [Crocinitomicaceae bacterium]